jgi:hypothetical protein
MPTHLGHEWDTTTACPHQPKRQRQITARSKWHLHSHQPSRFVNMKYLRIIDQIGNKDDIETQLIPRIGERILRRFKVGDQPMADHFYRVKDVEYRFDNDPNYQVGILIEEEKDPKAWPS